MRTIDQPTGEAGSPSAVVQVETGAESVFIPDAALFAGNFARSGSDLILEGPDGESLVVRDYFVGDSPPDLVADGARLNGETVETLAGPLAPGQYAQTGPDAGTEAIGEVTELTGSATVIRTNGVQENLSLGDPIFLGDTLRTGAGSSVGVTFIDDTLFSLSEDARLVIDQLIFNPGGGGNELSVSLLQGAAAFLAGQIAPSEGEGMKVTTPVGTIGVRGTSVVMFYDAVQQILESILLEDPDGTVGIASAFNNVSSQALTAFLEGVTITGLDQLIGPPELVDPSVLLAAKFALVIQSLGLNYANFIQNIAPEAGPIPDGGGGGGGGVGDFDPVDGINPNLFLLGPRGDLIELEILIDSRPELPFIEDEDPNNQTTVPPEDVDNLEEVVETLLPPADLDLDDNNDTDPVLPGGTGGSTGAEAAFEEAGGDVAGSGPTPVVDEDININFEGVLLSATVVLTNPLDGGSEGLQVDQEALPPGITAEISPDGTQVTLTGPASADDYEAALQAITYANDSENPTEADRIIEIVVNTAGGPSNTAISTIGVTATNDPPIVGIEDDSPGTVGGGVELAVTDLPPCAPGNFIEDDGPVIISDKVEITDVDSDTLVSATINLDSAPDGDAESLAVDLSDPMLAGLDGIGNISISPASTPTQLILEGEAPLETYQAVLRKVTYDNTSDTPTGEGRTITMSVNDGEDESNALEIEISIQAVNDPPVANPDMNMLTEDDNDSVSGNVLDGDDNGGVADEDVDGPEPLTVVDVDGEDPSVEGGAFVVGQFGALTIFSDGSYDYLADFGNEEVDALNVGDMVTDVFTYTVSDGEETDTATLEIKIKGANDAPVANDDMNTVTEDAATDTVSGDVINGDGNGGVADEDVDNDLADLEITDIAFDDVVEAVEETGTEIDGEFGTLTIFSDGSYDYTVDNENETVDGLIEGEMVTDVFTYTVSDGDKSDTATLSIKVNGANDGPIANPDMNMLTEDEDDLASGNVIDGDPDGGVEDEDPDSTGLTVTTIAFDGSEDAVAGEGGTEISGEFGTLTIFADGSYDYVADFGNAEVDALNVGEMVTDTFTYTISDGDETDTTTLAIKIKGANDAPEANDDTDMVMEAIDDAPSNTAEGNVIAGDGQSGEDTDVDNQDSDLSIFAVEGITGDVGEEVFGDFGTLVLNANGSYTYTPDDSDPEVNGLGENDTLTETFTYTVSDGDLTDTATLEIVIAGKNDSPLAEDDNDQVMEATEQDEGSFSAEGNVIDDSDSDVDSDLQVSAVQGNPANVGQQIAGAFGFLTLSEDGSYTYTPNDADSQVNGLNVGEMLTDTFTYTVSDGELSDTATLSIKINGKNDAPSLDLDADDSSEDVNPEFSIGATGFEVAFVEETITPDLVPSVVDPSPLAIEIVNGSGPVPVVDSDVAISDPESMIASAMVTLTNAPDGADEGLSVDTAALALIASGAITVAASSTATMLVLEGVAEAADYQAALLLVRYDNSSQDPDETDRLVEIKVTDEDGASSETAVTRISVESVNDLPVAADDMNMVTEDSGETISGNVIDGDANGGQEDIDPEGVELMVDSIFDPVEFENVAVTEPTVIQGQFGSVTINPDGSYDYIVDDSNPTVDALNVGDMVTDTFFYTVTDGELTDTAALDIIVKGANDAPIADNDSDMVMEAIDDAPSNTAEGNVIDGDGESGEDTDVDNERADLSIVEVEGVSSDVGEEVTGEFGTLVLNANGSYTYTPDDSDPEVNALREGDTETDVFTYTVSDGDLTDTATLEIVIAGKNDSPVLDETVMLMTPERVEVFDGEPTPVGTAGAQDGDIVGTVTATDAEDAPEDLTFTIDGGTGEDLFEIDEETGVVRIAPESAKDLDFETETSYSLDIVTTDTDGATESFTYMVEIKDINDAPEITSADDLCIDEDGGPLSLAGLQVDDIDDDPDDSNLYSVTISVDSGDLLVDSLSEGTEVSLLGSSLADINAFIDSISFEPDQDFGGLVSLRVEVNDENGDPSQRVVESFDIKVAPVADVPDIGVNDITVYEDNALLMTAGSFESGPFLFKETEENDPSEPDGVPDQLGVLAPASVLAFAGAIEDVVGAGANDLDAYAFTLAESGLVSFDFETEDGLPPNLDLTMTLVNTTGSEFEVGAFNPDAPFFLEAGTYRVELDGTSTDDGVPDLAYSAKISTNLDDKEPVWMAAGDVSQIGPIGVDPEIAPTDGDFQIRLTTLTDGDTEPKSGIPAVPVSDGGGDLNSFFGFEQGELEQSIFRLGSESEILEPVEGSGIKTTFTAQAGQVLTFDWTFLTNEGDEGSPFFDAAFAFVTPLGFPSELPIGLSDSDFVAADSATMFARQVDGMFSYEIPATGTYMLGIGVVDIDDGDLDSALIVDNVELDDAPFMSMFFDTDTNHRLPIFAGTVDEDGSEAITELKITATIDSAAPLSNASFFGAEPTAFFTIDGQQVFDGDTVQIFDDEGVFDAEVEISDDMLTLFFDEFDAPFDLDTDQIGVDLGRHFSGEVDIEIVATATEVYPDVTPSQDSETSSASFTLTIEGVADAAEIVDLGIADPEETDDGTPIINIGQEDAEEPIALPFQAAVTDMDGSECLHSIQITSTELDFSDPDLFWTFEGVEIGSDPELVVFDNPIGDDIEAMISVGGANDDVLRIDFTDPALTAQDVQEIEIGEIGIALPENVNGDIKIDISTVTQEKDDLGLPVMAGAETATQTDWFVLRVEPMNDAPVLEAGNDFSPVAQDDTDPNGNFVSQIVNRSDVDEFSNGGLPEAFDRGIAIIGKDDTGGTWEFSLDNGTTWNSVLTVSEGGALLLRSTDKVRFVPNESYVEDSDFGTDGASLTYRAWDGAPDPVNGNNPGGDAAAGGYWPIIETGGKTAFSDGTGTANAQVVAALDINMIITTGATEASPIPLGILLTGLDAEPDFFTDPSSLPEYLGFGAAIGIGPGDPLFIQTSNPAVGNVIGTDMLATGDGLTEVSSFFGLPIAEFTYEAGTDSGSAATTSFNYSVASNFVTDSASIGIDIRANFDFTDRSGGSGIDIIYSDSDTLPTLFGNGGDDMLVGADGGEGPEELYGGDGDDLIFGLDSANVSGFTGNDKIGGDGAGDLVGEGGNDLLFGGDGNDEISGDTGLVDGDIGDGESLGFAGDDKAYGEAGDDKLYGDAQDSWLGGTLGDDMLFGGADNDELFGDVGNSIVVTASNGTLEVSGGNDMLVGDNSEGNDELFGDAGLDLLAEASGTGVVSVTGGDDTLYGDNADGTGAGNDKIYGDAGRTIGAGQSGAGLNGGDASGGDDTAYGGGGNDEIFGDSGLGIVGGLSNNPAGAAAPGGTARGGHDTLFGGDDDDLIVGDAGAGLLGGNTSASGAVAGGAFGGNDSLDGGDGADTLIGDANGALAGGENLTFPTAVGGVAQGGDDTLDGGDGNDRLIGDSTLSLLAASTFGGGEALGGNDSLLGGQGEDELFGDTADDIHSFEEMAKGGDDDIYGGTESDTASGDAGNDLLARTISGGSGPDTIQWADAVGGNDNLFGGAGGDILNGDAGRDFLAGDILDDPGTSNLIAGDAIGGDDSISGGNDNDVINGDAGRDLSGGSISGGESGISYTAGTARGGNDSLNGEMGDDTIAGDAGGSLVAGDAFADLGAVLDGGDAIGGNDLIMGEDGDDVLSGDAGMSLSSAPEGGDGQAIGGDDELFGGVGNDDLFGDAVTGFFSGSVGGDDSLFGGAGNDTLIGDTGQTQFGGEAGDDFIDGGTGNDDLWGDSQTIFGGGTVTGSDVFFYDLDEDSGDDTIHDFEVEKDTLRLTDLLPQFDTIAELDAEASFSVAQTGGAGGDVEVTLGQGGGTITIENIGTAGGINSFAELDAAINLEINP